MNNFENTIINLYGDKGRQFLRNLNEICHFIRIDNNINELIPVGDWTYHAIYKCVFNGNVSIIKLGVDYEDLSSEISFLEIYSSGIGPDIYKKNKNPAYYIMEYIEGNDLSNIESEEERCVIFANILNNLKKTEIKDFKTVVEYKNDLKYKSKYISKIMIEKASSIITKNYDSSDLFLLHGDLHHYNIIGNRFIDPKGIIGSKIFELGPFLRNELDNIEHLRKKIRILESLTDFNQEQIIEIAFLDFVLSIIWLEIDNIDVPKTHLEMIEKIWYLL